MSNPRTSVIIPVHNSEKYLEQCLDSVLAQTERNIEIICVDDGSTDNSSHILDRYASRDDRIQVVHEACHGAGAARNRGLANANGTFLAFLDSDDFFEPDMLASAADRLDETDADVAVFGSWVYDTVRQQDRVATWHHRIDHLPKNNPFNYQDMPRFIFNSFGNFVWNKLFRKDFVVGHNLKFQEISHSNDQLFACACLVLAKKIVSLDSRFAHYRMSTGHNLQATNDRNPLAFSAPFEPLEKLLVERGIFNCVQESFLNWIVDGVTYNVDTLHTREAFYKLRQGVIEQIEPRYNILDQDPSIFENPSQLRQYRDLVEQNPEDYFIRRILALEADREDLYWLNDWREWKANALENELAKVKDALNTMTFENDRLRNSASYRLGHALLEPIRPIKRLLSGKSNMQ